MSYTTDYVLEVFGEESEAIEFINANSDADLQLTTNNRLAGGDKFATHNCYQSCVNYSGVDKVLDCFAKAPFKHFPVYLIIDSDEYERNGVYIKYQNLVKFIQLEGTY